jgi:transposase, IS30 family
MENFTQLVYQERVKIYNGKCAGMTISAIAEMIGRSTSTVSRELRRNSDQIGYCYPGQAHQMAQERKNKNEPKIDKNVKLKKYIIEKLGMRWSPKIIAGRWNLENEHTISPEAIYQWIYSDEGEQLGLKKLLIRARKKRGLKRRPKKCKIKNRVSVHVRPEHINQRIEPGHYECDLMFNSGSQSKNVCTMIDRVTRQAILVKNETKHAKPVADSIIQSIEQAGVTVKSITFDNGSEFADHERLKTELGIETYFCDPGSPWQKGSIENLNGVTRRYLPFDQSAHEITPERVAEVNDLLNNMPRAIFGFRTPLEIAQGLSHV